jgi:hypothetical protein
MNQDHQQHRATPEQWAEIEGESWNSESWNSPRCSAIIELRNRIEALEAAQHAHAGIDIATLTSAEKVELGHFKAALEGAPTPEARPGGLVERVAATNNAPEAIREVAAWLEQQQEVPIGCSTASADYFAAMLKEEANRG